MNKQALATVALAAVLSVGIAPPAEAGSKEKCYGVAKAGQNDCSNLAGTHSCAGQSTVDNDPGEWMLVRKGSCEKIGGMLKAEAKKKYKESQQG